MEDLNESAVPGIAFSRQSVDPAISRVKFARELEKFKSIESFNRERGIVLIRAEFPDIVLAFMTFRIRPVVVAFTVRINFTNYNLEPPSVQFIDPLTERLVREEELCTRLPRKVDGGQTVTLPNGHTQVIPNMNFLIQAHKPHNIPFLCLPGIREYHNHPFHTNDPWLAHRTSGEGTLGYIVDQLHAYGNNPIVGCGSIPQEGLSRTSCINIQLPGMNLTTFDTNYLSL
jgi:hypothetical protein